MRGGRQSAACILGRAAPVWHDGFDGPRSCWHCALALFVLWQTHRVSASLSLFLRGRVGTTLRCAAPVEVLALLCPEPCITRRAATHGWVQQHDTRRRSSLPQQPKENQCWASRNEETKDGAVAKLNRGPP